MSAKSYEDRYRMPGILYIAVSRNTVIDGKRLYKLGMTTKDMDYRLGMLNYKRVGDCSDWEEVFAGTHEWPTKVEEMTLPKLSVYLQPQWGREVFLCKNERPIEDAMSASLDEYEAKRKAGMALYAKRVQRHVEMGSTLKLPPPYWPLRDSDTVKS